MDGEISDTAGLGVFCVNPASPGISIRNYATVDDRRAADITFDNTPAETLLGSGSGAYRAVERAVERAVVYLCAEGLGAMQALSEATLAYVRVRQQFGQPIGNFQSLQHRIVDMRVQLELSRAITLRACASLELSPNERARAVSAAKAHVGRSARVVGRAAIQLHGGIGMTNELAIGQYFKRLLFVETMLGDIDFHQKRFMNFVSAA
jgi:alkylation response protein AidB-like acyl-CoA dehydrogenase